MPSKLLDSPSSRTRHHGKPIPREGDRGLFTQSWFPICLATAVAPGAVKGFDFLDGRVVVFRGANGLPRVLSAYCPHLGADLAVGSVVGDELRCAFHHWRFDAEGRCVATAIGDPAPPGACLFAFPTCEKYGIVWAFNGETSSWELPDFPYPESELVVRAQPFQRLPLDPWQQCCQTPDFQHIRTLHGIQFQGTDPEETLEWTDHSMRYEFTGLHPNGITMHHRMAIYGTTIFFQNSVIEDQWFGVILGMGMPRPGESENFLSIAIRRDSKTPEQLEGILDMVTGLEMEVLNEDLAIMTTMRLRPGTLSRSDRTLSRFFKYLRSYPRAHPSREFLR